MSSNQSTRTKSLCLCMIVKNEASVIARAIKSVHRIIDYWVICDTGSTDDTPAIILQLLAGTPGELHRKEWVNFGHNRTEAIQLAKDKADYILIMDADMIANIHAPFKDKLVADCYEIRYTGDTDYTQPMLVSGKIGWAYEGVTHEYIHALEAKTSETLTELTLTHVGDGNNKSEKFERDIRLLEEELKRDPTNIRNAFYLAQSYKDFGDYENALRWYDKRIALGVGWDEEYWYALYQRARAQELSQEDWSVVLLSYLKAFSTRPTRLEPLYQIVRYYREREEYQMGYLYSSRIGRHLEYPKDHLFIEKSVYDYKLYLEHAVCASAIGYQPESLEFYNLILERGNLPQWVFESVLKGRNLALNVHFPPKTSFLDRTNRIKVLVPFYNPGVHFSKCIDSLINQDYPHVQFIFYDDVSDDDSYQQIPEEDDRIQLIRGDKKRPLAETFHVLYTRYCDPEDIVVHVDADDWLDGTDVLSYINSFYNKQDCWVMYGQYTNATGEMGVSMPYASPKEFNMLRSLPWRASHIRTFRAGLYHRLEEQDPTYSSMKDDQGKWYEAAVDAAVMYPLVELAGYSKVRFNERILYRYNNKNETSISHARRALQLSSYNHIMGKRPFLQIDHYLPVTVVPPLDDLRPSEQVSEIKTAVTI